VEVAAVGVGEEAMVGAPEAVTREAAWAPAAAAAMEVEAVVTGREAAKGEAVEAAAAARGATPPRSVVRSRLGEAGS
jgi:hypothetical protein